MSEKVQPIQGRVLVEMNGEFNDRIKLSNGDELYLDTSFEYFEHANQNGVVKYVSDEVREMGVSEGDKIWFHHFVPVDQTLLGFKPNFDDNLLRLTGSKLYWVEDKQEQIFAYQKENEDVKCFRDTVLISKIVTESERTKSGIILEAYDTKEVFEEGIIEFSNKELEKNGFNVGDHIKFTPNSEYELNVNDTVYYKMRTRDIILKYENSTVGA